MVSTYPDRRALSRVAREAVESGLAACVSVSRVSSTYMWKGSIEDAQEYLALFKTTQKCKARLRRRIRETHPYDVPEIAEIDMKSVDRPYMEWLVRSTG